MRRPSALGFGLTTLRLVGFTAVTDLLVFISDPRAREGMQRTAQVPPAHLVEDF